MPKLPEFGTTLEQLGYKVAGNDQVVDSEGNFFKFFVSDTDQVNLKHKEAAHEATRTVIFDKLGEYEVKKVYLQGGDGLFCTHDLPPRENPYVQILATDLKELKKKSDVVVVIPDHNMDLGTVSYRELMGPGGIERGSVLGLVKELSGMEFTQLPKKPKKTYYEPFKILSPKSGATSGGRANSAGESSAANRPESSESESGGDGSVEVGSQQGTVFSEGLGFTDASTDNEPRRSVNSEAASFDIAESTSAVEGPGNIDRESGGSAAVTDDDAEDYHSAAEEFEDEVINAPGIIVLSTGELHYSYNEHRPYSVQGWLARDREHALQDVFPIELQYTRVRGHGTAQEHVDTALGKLLPAITAQGSSIYVLTVSDASEYLVKYMNGRLEDPQHKMMIPTRCTKATAFFEPTHDPDKITNDLIKLKFAKLGKSWMLSEYPHGIALAVPTPVSPGARAYEDQLWSDPIDIPLPTVAVDHIHRRRTVKALDPEMPDDHPQRFRPVTTAAERLTGKPRPGPVWPQRLLDAPDTLSSGQLSLTGSRRPSPTASDKAVQVEAERLRAETEPNFPDVFDVTDNMSGEFKKRAIPTIGRRSDISSAVIRERAKTVVPATLFRDFGYLSAHPLHAAPPPLVEAKDSNRNTVRAPTRARSVDDFDSILRMKTRKKELKAEARERELREAREEREARAAAALVAATALLAPQSANDYDSTESFDANECAIADSSEESSPVAEQESAKMAGGDFDDDGEEESGMWMKKYEKDSADTVSEGKKEAQETPASKSEDEKEDTMESVPDLVADSESSDSDSDAGVPFRRRSRGDRDVSPNRSAGSDRAASPGTAGTALTTSESEPDKGKGKEVAKCDSVITVAGPSNTFNNHGFPQPEGADMLRVSSGEDREVELIWGKCIGEVVGFFKEMAKKNGV